MTYFSSRWPGWKSALCSTAQSARTVSPHVEHTTVGTPMQQEFRCTENAVSMWSLCARQLGQKSPSAYRPRPKSPCRSLICNGIRPALTITTLPATAHAAHGSWEAIFGRRFSELSFAVLRFKNRTVGYGPGGYGSGNLSQTESKTTDRRWSPQGARGATTRSPGWWRCLAPQPEKAS